MENKDNASLHILEKSNISAMVKHYEYFIPQIIELLPTLKDSNFSLIFMRNYEEIRQCVALQLFGCAMVGLGALVEQLLDEAIIMRREKKKGCKLSGQEKEDICKKQLAGTITMAVDEGVIGSSLAGKLKVFKDDIRNSYTHGNCGEIIKDVKLEEELSALNDVVKDFLKKNKKDIENAICYINWVHRIIGEVSKNLDTD